MLDKIYYDSFANEYCIPDEDDLTIAPQEKYIATYRGTGIYIETWEVGLNPNGNRLQIAYTERERKDRKLLIELYKSMEDRHECRLVRLLHWTIPSEKFDEYVERFGLE